ncbi:MAG: DUF2490 domain-containing protein [Candidatus Melainabacteria bacterium]|nr:DUF2490 domain-containing protein [Candidatus Melainabacteria bacterium]
MRSTCVNIMSASMIALGLVMLTTQISKAASSSSKNPDPDYSSWNSIPIQFPIHKKLGGYFEVQPRWSRLPVHNFAELVTRSGVTYDINKHASLAGGYYWTPLFNPKLNYDNRLWQQLTSSHHLSKLKLQNRVRFEEIWRDQYDGTSVRFRDQLKFMYPIGETKWSIVGSEEPIWNVNTREHGPQRGWNQNRVFIGLGRQINAVTRIECGYLNQYKIGHNGKPNQVNHVLVAQLSLDLRKLKLHGQTKLAQAPQAPNTTSIPPNNHLADVDVTQTAKDIKLVANVPNMEIQDLELIVGRHTVTIKNNKQQTGLQPISLASSPFEKVIQLPCDIERDQAEATLCDGKLTVVLPKQQESVGKKIAIHYVKPAS